MVSGDLYNSRHQQFLSGPMGGLDDGCPLENNAVDGAMTDPNREETYEISWPFSIDFRANRHTRRGSIFIWQDQKIIYKEECSLSRLVHLRKIIRKIVGFTD